MTTGQTKKKKKIKSMKKKKKERPKKNVCEKATWHITRIQKKKNGNITCILCQCDFFLYLFFLFFTSIISNLLSFWSVNILSHFSFLFQFIYIYILPYIHIYTCYDAIHHKPFILVDCCFEFQSLIIIVVDVNLWTVGQATGLIQNKRKSH